MTFPTIPTVAAGRVLTGVQANTTATRTFPNLSGLTKNAGDRLIAICIAYQTSTGTNAAFSGWTAGWTERHDSATSTTLAIGIAEKISDGTETGTISVTQAGTITGHAVFILLSIPAAHASTPIEVNGRASGTTAAADPAAVTPSWGARDTLWIAVGGTGETNTSGTHTGTTAAPTNYTDFVATALSGDVVGGVDGAVAFRQLNAASENAGTFTFDLSNARNAAVVIAVRPTPNVFSEPLTTTGTADTTIVTKDKMFLTTTGTVTTPVTDGRRYPETLTTTATASTPATESAKRSEIVTTTGTTTTTLVDGLRWPETLTTTITCTADTTDALQEGGGNVPQNVVATSTGASTMTVTWDSVPVAIAYDIERNGVVIATDHPASPFNDTGLSPSTEYTYRVRSVL